MGVRTVVKNMVMKRISIKPLLAKSNNLSFSPLKCCCRFNYTSGFRPSTSTSANVEPIGTKEQTFDSVIDIIDSSISKKIENTRYSALNAGISESDVGITQYLSPELGGFKGILKQRYTDFLVNEIDRKGNVIHLVDLGSCDIKGIARERDDSQQANTQLNTDALNDTETAHEHKPDKSSLKNEPFVLSLENREKLATVFNEKVIDGMISLLRDGPQVVTEESVNNKDERTKIHEIVRKVFQSRLDTRTTNTNSFVITLASGKNRNNMRKSKAGNNSNDADKAKFGLQKEYLHFTLYKENKETMQVANILAKLLRTSPKSISYAGTKDRRGITVQRASISKMKAERLNGLNKKLRGIKFGSFKYEDDQIKLGDLKGNEFYITIRNVDQMDETINASLDSLRNNGFINYFGMQRFGTFSVPTHIIGTHVLKSDWETAAKLILSPQKLAAPDSIAARNVWAETGDAKEALKLMPRKCVAEHNLLQVLSETPNDFFNAIMKIPRNLRLMYSHAYQSYIWNCVASERIKRYGATIMEGDLVLMTEEEKIMSQKQAVSVIEETETVGTQENTKQDIFVRARPVTKEEIENGTKTVFDVVLPTPGFDVRYPENDLKQVYIDEMKKDGLDPDDMNRNIREFSLTGSYRHLITKPESVEWWIRKYNEETEQMVNTDLDLLEKSLDQDGRIIQTSNTGSKTAVLLKIQLGVSQYATMALREVMKLDTKRHGEGFEVKLQSGQ